jgi:hypothetical protein
MRSGGRKEDLTQSSQKKTGVFTEIRRAAEMQDGSRRIFVYNYGHQPVANR